MKTLIIYIEEMPKFAIIEGDYSELNGVMINRYEDDTTLQNKAVDLLYNPETGILLIDFSEDISIVENKMWDKVALITFLL